MRQAGTAGGRRFDLGQTRAAPALGSQTLKTVANSRVPVLVCR